MYIKIFYLELRQIATDYKYEILAENANGKNSEHNSMKKCYVKQVWHSITICFYIYSVFKTFCCCFFRWAEGFVGWGHPVRCRHVTSGRFLAVNDEGAVCTYHRAVATQDSTAFLLRQSKVKL